MLDDLLLRKLAAVELRYEELSNKLSDPAVIANRQSMQKLSKEHADLRELIEVLREHREIVKRSLRRAELQDPEMRDLAHQRGSIVEQSGLQRMTVLLMPRDPNDDKNIRSRSGLAPA